MESAPDAELTTEERAEVKRLLESSGWLDARDYLRSRSYSVEQAPRPAMPGRQRRRETQAESGPPSERKGRIESIGDAPGNVLFAFWPWR
jgi:hypothetical protein